MKLVRVTVSLFLVFSVVFTLFFGLGEIKKEYKIEETPEYKGILSIWQIDSFEGGTGSRRKFLLSAAKTFEKSHEGVLIMVTNYNEEGVKENLEKGIYPDMISFGIGTEVKGFGKIKVESKNYNLSGGKIDGKTYAVPWCRGSYALVKNPKLAESFTPSLSEVIVSKGENTQPLAALGLSGYTAEKIEIKEPMEAYVKFVSGKVPYFLCTQRDLVRLSNRNFDFDALPLNGYNDLYQYISVTTKSSDKYYYCEEFINYLIGEKCQNELKSISMFSPYFDLSYDGAYGELSKNIPSLTLSAFSDRGAAEKLALLSESLVLGDKSSEIKIKNMLIVP